MSFVEKSYGLLMKMKSLFSKKLFKFFLFFFATAIMMFGVLNVYAQTDKVSPAWSGSKTFYNEASGLSGDDVLQDNVTSHSGQLGLNTAWVIFATLAPGMTEGADTIVQDPNVPADLKLGLTGFIDQAWATVYEEAPGVNVIAHLQEEWVPGYNESKTGLYAAEDTQSGYESLMDSGISKLWIRFRDMAYVLLVIVMIVVGFMIMFRNKIGGQLVVSIGNTIPNVIISLVLITFSFAIAGVIIDIGGIAVSLLYSIFEEKSVSIQDFGALFSVLFKGGSVMDYINVVGNDFKSIGTSFSTDILKGIGDIWLSIWGTMMMGIWGLIAFILALGVVAIGAIKLLIVLYKAYFELILNVILSPIKILIGAFPGNEAVRTNWFTGLIRNVLVFPIVYFIVNIPVYISSILSGGDNNVVLSFPTKLTGANLGDAGVSLSTGDGYIGLIINFILRVFVLYYACQAPKFAEAIIPVKETNRAAADAMAGAKMGMSKIPLVGGLFK